MTTADLFLKASVKNCQVIIRDRTGEPIIRCIGKNDLDAIRKLRRCLDQVALDNENKPVQPASVSV